MGKAGKALKQVLETYKIPQNRLAKSMQIERSAVYKWVHEEQDMTGESIANAVQALRSLSPEAAEAFIQLYLGLPNKREPLA
jgi:plasmid maintenance system antidote protein VapI